MRLIIDQGNTRTKYAWVDQEGKLGPIQSTRFPLELVENIHAKAVEAIIISDVSEVWLNLKEHLPQSIHICWMSHQLKLPVEIKYEQPERLGKDRLCAVIGAQQIYPNKNILSIDIGTCITYDLLTKEGIYVGGSISPGARLRAQAMNEFTAALPMVNLSEDVQLPAQSTVTCLQSGIEYGIRYEIEGMIAHYEQLFGEIVPILCGGDANFFESKIKAPIFVHENLVMTGLKKILELNIDNEK